MSVVVLWMLEGPTAGGAHAWAPFFILKNIRKRGYLMAQKFMTYEQQINKLQADPYRVGLCLIILEEYI